MPCETVLYKIGEWFVNASKAKYGCKIQCEHKVGFYFWKWGVCLFLVDSHTIKAGDHIEKAGDSSTNADDNSENEDDINTNADI